MRTRSTNAIVLATVGIFAARAGAQAIDGQLGTGSFAYGEYPFRLATQTTATGFGNNQSQLDAVYVNVLSNGTLAYMMTGNIESNGNGFVTLIDTGHDGAVGSTNAGGYGVLHAIDGRYTSTFGTNRTSDGNNPQPDGPGSVFSPGFNPRYALETNLFGNTYYQDFVNLGASSRNDYYLGSNAWRDKIQNTGATGPAAPVTQNYNLNNTAAGNDANITSAYDDNNTVTFTAGSPTLAAYGYEAQFTAQLLRQKPGTQTKLLLYIAGGDSFYLSNQFLPGLPSGTANLATIASPTNANARFDVTTQTDHPQDFYLTVPTPTVTSASASVDWSDNAAWNTGFSPNGINTQAAIDTGGVAKTVTLSSPVTTGTLHLTGAGSVTVAGADLTFQTFSDSGDATVLQASGGGNHTVSANVVLASSLSAEVATGTKVTANVIKSADQSNRTQSLALSGGGTLVVHQSYAAGPISVTSGLLAFDPGAGGVISGSAASAVGSLVASWYASGARNGSGIGANTTDPLITIGAATNDNGEGGTLYPTFLGYSAGTTDVLLKATYIGDTDLNGLVDGNDLANLLAGMNGGLSGWQNGDINYDGVVDGTDLANLLAGLRGQGSPLGGSNASGGGAIPEPAGLTLIAPLGMALCRRRR